MFLAPVHRLAQNPTLQLEEDMRLVEHLDALGFDEAWFGEHHSGGAEIIASPEVFIAAAAQRTRHIRLGTGVNSLPYHNPFILADRWVLLSHLTRGRAMFGVGPGSLPSDSWQMGLNPLEQREHMEAALEAIVALLDGDEPVTRRNKWFELRDARLHIRPFGGKVDLRVASMTSPAGPRACGRFGIGMMSVAATTLAGFEALKDAWQIAEDRADEFGKTVDRSNWSVVAPMHIAESVEQAHRDVEYGLGEWLHYFQKLVPLPIESDPGNIRGAIKELNDDTGLAVIGTPEMAIEQVQRLLDQTGGFGCFLIQAHDWADPEATRRSYELFARHVIPHFQGQIQVRSQNQEWVMSHASHFKSQFAGAQEKARQDHDAETAMRASAVAS